MRRNDPNVFPCLEGGVQRWEAGIRIGLLRDPSEVVGLAARPSDRCDFSSELYRRIMVNQHLVRVAVPQRRQARGDVFRKAQLSAGRKIRWLISSTSSHGQGNVASLSD